MKSKLKEGLKQLVESADIRINRKNIKAVTWCDAVTKKLPSEYFETLEATKSGANLLCINVTFGEVHELNDVVIIITEKSTVQDYEVTIVPKGWIIKIE
ncbi:MAG: hypothetical protein IIA87_03310 [Nanoarchaeota archaeon]|nr:hypothetical protein [Nanoarchaeota archaeon]